MGRPKAELTRELVDSLVEYNPETGVFTWLKPSTRVRAGDVVGSLDAHGYLVSRIRGNSVKLHRLAWFISTGDWPKGIDHINRCKTDNRLCNLRPVTDETVQQQNRELQRNNTTGVKGVHYRKDTDRYIARVRVGKRVAYYREFGSLDAAVEARIAAELRFHPFSPLHAEARVAK